MHHEEFRQLGVAVACITRESVDSNRRWRDRLDLPYPLLADTDGLAARALRAVRTVAIGPWTLEFVRRTTVLVDARGEIAAVWGKVKLRGHALDVLHIARAVRTGRSA